jgi:hypothetical protein
VTWHSPTRLSVVVEARAGDALVVPQNWDTVWTATVRGRELPVERIGPNFLAARLDGVAGPVTVEVRHGPYPTWTAAFVMMGLGLLTAIVAAIVEVRASGRRPAISPRAPGPEPPTHAPA